MSIEEEMAARGRLVTEYAEAKKRLAVLENEAKRVGQHFRNFGDRLIQAPSSVDIPPDLNALLGEPEKVRGLVKEMRDTRGQLAGLKQKVKELGLEG